MTAGVDIWLRDLYALASQGMYMAEEIAASDTVVEGKIVSASQAVRIVTAKLTKVASLAGNIEMEGEPRV